MMFRSGRTAYLEGRGFQAVSLAYGQGRLAMVIFLPDEDFHPLSLADGLDSETRMTWLSSMSRVPVMLLLPRFRVECEATLSQALSQLGMAVAFDVARAHFGGMCPAPGGANPGIYIDGVKHKAYLETGEEGTGAAATTSVLMVARRAGPVGFCMIVDRPFLCAVVERETGLPLFLGMVADP